MIRFDVNLSILFTELPLLPRPAAAAEAGFDAVELWWPFDRPVPSDIEVDTFVRAVRDAGVRLAGLNFYAGDLAAGDRGVLSDPVRVNQFLDNLDVAVGIAAATGCRVLNALYGNRISGVPEAEQDELAAANLTAAVAMASTVDAVVVVEALNAAENPRYPLRTAADVAPVCTRTGARFLCDLYHLARNGEDLPTVLSRHTGLIGHVQLADIPARTRPGTGDLNVAGLLGTLTRLGYAGYVGLEYRPLGPSGAEFDWLPRELRSTMEREQS